MMRSLPLVLGLVALLLLSVPAFGQDGEPEKPAPAPKTGEEADDVPSPTREEILRRNKEVWDRMTPEERKRALERLKKFQKLSEAERKRLLAEAKRLIGKLDRETRRKMAEENRRKEWKRAYDEMRKLLGRLFKRLPESLRNDIETLDRKEKQGLERLILSRLFEAQADAARKSLDEETRKRLHKAARYDRHRYMRLLFDHYKKTILAQMPEVARKRIAAQPKVKRKKLKDDYAKRVIEQKLVELVSRTVLPDLEELMKLPAAERRQKIHALTRGHKQARRGPRGFPSPWRLTKEEKKKLEGMTEEQRKAFFEKKNRKFQERMRKSLAEKGLTSAELDALAKVPIHRRWRTLQRSHPELFERLSAEERARLAKLSPEQRQAFYERKRKRHEKRLSRELEARGATPEELTRLMAMPPLLRWIEIEKTHPEWVRHSIRDHGKNGRRGGPHRGPRRGPPDRKPPKRGDDEGGG